MNDAATKSDVAALRAEMATRSAVDQLRELIDRMATRSDVSELRTELIDRMATKSAVDQLRELVDRMATRSDDLKAYVEGLATATHAGFMSAATKADLERFATKADLANALEPYATKADLEQLRIATKADLEQLRIALNADLTSHINAMYERSRDDFRALDDQAKGVTERQTRGELATDQLREELDLHRADPALHRRR